MKLLTVASERRDDHDADADEDGLERIMVPRENYNSRSEPSLARALQWLYALNGASQSLPSTALMYIINTRVAIPIAYLSVYGALAFLPFSLKPLYAHLSNAGGQRHHRRLMLVILLALGGVVTAMFSLVSTITCCIVLAVLRGITTAWPEFILDLLLMEQCCTATATIQDDSNTTTTTAAALFQSQAATCRNMGTLVGNLVAFLVLILTSTKTLENENDHIQQHHQPNNVVVTGLLVATGLLNVVGAGIAWYSRIGIGVTTCPHATSTHSSTAVDEEQQHSTTRQHPKPSSCLATNDAFGIVILQSFILLFALQQPLTTLTSSFTWHMVALLFAMVLIIHLIMASWTTPRRVAALLICKHSTPSSSYVMSSFLYTLFQSSPFLYQSLGLWNNLILTIASWSYGKLFASFSSGKQLSFLLAGTMILGAMSGILNIVLTNLTSENEWYAFIVVAMVQIGTGIMDEWAFLPSVVLATTTAIPKYTTECELVSNTEVEEDGGVCENHDNVEIFEDESEEEDGSSLSASYYQQQQQQQQHDRFFLGNSSSNTIHAGADDATTSTTAMQYGTLLSCIDFGDQIGSWLTVPLIMALGMSRENDWEHLDRFLLLSSGISLLPILLLPILLYETKEHVTMPFITQSR